MDVREKLEEYRRQRQALKEPEDKVGNQDVVDNDEIHFLNNENKFGMHEVEDEKGVTTTIPNWILFVFYLIFQLFFYWFEFGMAFFIVAVLMFVYLNTGTRKNGEMSAYSVFNEQCQRLPGQMTAEHFERDILRQRR